MVSQKFSIVVRSKSKQMISLFTHAYVFVWINLQPETAFELRKKMDSPKKSEGSEEKSSPQVKKCLGFANT